MATPQYNTQTNSNGSDHILKPEVELKEHRPEKDTDNYEETHLHSTIPIQNITELSALWHSELKVKNIYLEVINARYIKPMDTKILKMLVKQNKPVFVYEEVVSTGSLGSEIAKYLLEQGFNNIYENYTVPDEFIKQGKRNEIIKLLHLDKNSIIKNIEKKMKKCK